MHYSDFGLKLGIYSLIHAPLLSLHDTMEQQDKLKQFKHFVRGAAEGNPWCKSQSKEIGAETRNVKQSEGELFSVGC